MLNQQDCKREAREASSSLLYIDSQSDKLSPMIFEHRGVDAHKKVNGRKRQLLVDTGGWLWRVCVHAAHEHDGVAGGLLLDACTAIRSRLQKILGDSAFKDAFAQKAAEHRLAFEAASRPQTAKGFVPIAKRWVV